VEITADDLEFQGESVKPVEKSDEETDALERDAPLMDVSKECVGAPIVLDHTNDVFFGESIVSIRQLMKRYIGHSRYRLGYGPAAGVIGVTTVVDYNFPRYRGYISDGEVNTLLGRANMTRTNVMTYITPCFMGYRGAQRSKYAVNVGIGGVNPSVYYTTINRDAFAAASGYSEQTVDVSYATSNDVKIQADGILSDLSGSEVFRSDVQPVGEVEFPHYSDLRFFHTKDLLNMALSDYSLLKHRVVTSVAAIGANSGVADMRRYVSVGEDFQLFLYQGQPPLYPLPSITPA